MSDLISSKALIKRLQQWNTNDATDKALYNFAMNRIIEQPIVEDVPKSYADQIRWERDIAIEQLNEIGCQFGQKMDEVKKKLETLQWSPCSERLPDTDVQVLVTLGYTYESDYTMYSIARYIHFENGECHWCDNFYGYLEWDKYSDGRGGDSSRKVIAWCPLPPVYKGD